MRVFLDANVIFSASNPGSIMSKLVEHAALRVDLVINSFVEEEARRNLSLKRPEWIYEFERIIEKTEQATVIIFDIPVDLDDKDQPVLCSAIRSNCQYLVTGDQRDFGHLYDKKVKDVTVISTRQFAEILKGIPRRSSPHEK